MTTRLSVTLLFTVALSSASCAPQPIAPATVAAAPAITCDRARDQKAILAMAGSYDVVFDFAETEVLTPGYEKHEPHKSYATERVLVIENTEGRVSLQHILQIGSGKSATLIKHWRQDWSFEDPELLEFQGKEVWKKRTLSPEVTKCTWKQSVSGVDDAPRYDGFGRWQHTGSGAEWMSNLTWRPLPRREYTTRSDYDVLVAVNRHRITPKGWEHEQDNVKLVLEPRRTLVKEHGLNRYEHGDPKDTAEAVAYWQETAPFWAEVNKEWQRVFAQGSVLSLQSEASGTALHDKLFELAERRRPVDDETRRLIQATLGLYLRAQAQP
jgi:hypothetical protein